MLATVYLNVLSILSVEMMEVLEIHHYPHLMDQCCDLINMEWPRSKTARLRTLEMSCDRLPTCLILVQSNEVIGHSKISPIPSLPSGCFIESVIIHPKHRGKGLGKLLMTKTEDYVRSHGLRTAYLSTKDQQGFYSKLGYNVCEPVSVYGGCVNSKWKTETVKSISPKVNISDDTCLAYPHILNTCKKTNSVNGNIIPAPPPPPPPPPPPLPESFDSVRTSSLAKTYMKKNL